MLSTGDSFGVWYLWLGCEYKPYRCRILWVGISIDMGTALRDNAPRIVCGQFYFSNSKGGGYYG
jgi:hypothetical protein